MKKNISLKTIKEENLRTILEISYGPTADLEWMKYNGPYFSNPVETWIEFSMGYGKSLINDLMSKAIMLDDKIVGIVTAYWEDFDLKHWLEIGILIYDSNIWGNGIGNTAISLWLKELFTQFDYLPHIGFTTWSGNEGMQKIGEKCGMKKEAVIRKVRYLNGKYYDSVKYGILREELII